nr:MAG TPA: hypothetical protein [Caudoviricetes sp.]
MIAALDNPSNPNIIFALQNKNKGVHPNLPLPYFIH